MSVANNLIRALFNAGRKKYNWTMNIYLPDSMKFLSLSLCVCFLGVRVCSMFLDTEMVKDQLQQSKV